MARELRYDRVREALPRILQRIRERETVQLACARESVPRRSFYDLRDADPTVREAVEAAQAEAMGEDLAELRTHIREGSRSAAVHMHLMERLYPSEFKPPKQRGELSGEDGGPVRIEASALPSDPTERAKLRAELEARAAVLLKGGE
jgi:hypothetical protein